MTTELKKLWGMGFAFFIALMAWALGKHFPIIGSPVFGILLGMLIAFWKRPITLNTGISFVSKRFLKVAIILLGFNLNLTYVLVVGKETLVLMIFTLSSTFITAYLVGKWLKIGGNTNILIGVGTAICGGSAIAATAPVIDANESEVASAISTIFFFNVIAALLFPLIGHVFGMSDSFFGLWAGTAINDTSSVVAAGYTYSNAAGDLAVIVKLTRTLMIIPVTTILAFYRLKKDHGNEVSKLEHRMGQVFPWFVLGFLAASMANTLLVNSWGPWADLAGILSTVGKFFIVMAMTAIGLNTHLVKLVKNGLKPIMLGLITWIILAIVSILVQLVIYN